MVDVIMAVSKKTLGMVVGVPVCVALAGAVYHYGKVKRQADIDAAAAEEEKAAAYEKWAKAHRDECLELVPVSEGGFIGVRELDVTITQDGVSKDDGLGIVELIRPDGNRAYMYDDKKAFRKYKWLFDDVASMHKEDHDNFFYSPDPAHRLYCSLRKILPGFGCIKLDVDEDCTFFSDEVVFDEKLLDTEAFMSKQEYETASDSERKHIDDMTYLWRSNNMLQLLGRDCYEAWKPMIERFSK